MRWQKTFLLILVLLITQSVFADKVIDAITAVYQNDFEILQKLLDDGLDPNLTGVENYQASLLSTACANNSLEMVKYLLKNGVDVTIKGYGDYTPLMWSAESAKTTEIMELLLDEGAEIDAIAQDGVNALIKAIFGVLSGNGSIDAVKLLLNNGMDVNYSLKSEDGNGYTALMFACRWGKIEVVKYLISVGADVNLKDDYGASALSIANEEGFEEIVQLLTDSGAKN